MIDIPELVDDADPAVAAVRHEFMQGLTTVGVLAKALDKSERQIQAYLSEGMPHVRYGKKPYPIVIEAKKWLAKRQTG